MNEILINAFCVGQGLTLGMMELEQVPNSSFQEASTGQTSGVVCLKHKVYYT